MALGKDLIRWKEFQYVHIVKDLDNLILSIFMVYAFSFIYCTFEI